MFLKTIPRFTIPTIPPSVHLGLALQYLPSLLLSISISLPHTCHPSFRSAAVSIAPTAIHRGKAGRASIPTPSIGDFRIKLSLRIGCKGTKNISITQEKSANSNGKCTFTSAYRKFCPLSELWLLADSISANFAITFRAAQRRLFLLYSLSLQALWRTAPDGLKR